MKKLTQLSLIVLLAVAITGGLTAPSAFAEDCETQAYDDFGACGENYSTEEEYSSCICAAWREWQTCWASQGIQQEIPRSCNEQ